MSLRPILLVVFLCGCGASVDSVARQASKAAVGEGAEALTEEQTQESLAEASKDPELQAATERMTDQIADGVLKSLAEPAAKDQITGLTRSITEGAVKEMLAELGSRESKAQLAGLTSAITESAMRQVVESLQNDVRPAMRALIREDIGPEVAAVLSSQLQPALGTSAQTVAYNAVVGANRSLDDALTGDQGLAARGDEVARVSRAWLWLPLTVLGLMTLMLVAFAVAMVARSRRARAEVQQLEKATLLLATAMRERQKSEDRDELVALVESALAKSTHQSGEHRVLRALGLRKSG